MIRAAALVWALSAAAAVAAEGCHEFRLAGAEEAAPALAARAEALGGRAEGLTVVLPPEADPAAAEALLTRPGRLSFHAIIGRNGEIDPEGALIPDAAVAAAQVRDGGAGPMLFIALGEEDAARLGEITSAQVGDTLAVALDGSVVVAPRVVEPILGGELVIAADFGREALADMALIMAAPLPGEVAVEAVGEVACPAPEAGEADGAGAEAN